MFAGIDIAEARKMNFNYIGKIIGPKVRTSFTLLHQSNQHFSKSQGAYVKHIESQSRARVQLKGKRSDNPAEQADEDEEMHLLIIASNKQVEQFALNYYLVLTTDIVYQAMETAKKLSEDLLNTVREDFEEQKKNFAARNASSAGGYGGYRGSFPPMPPGCAILLSRLFIFLIVDICSSSVHLTRHQLTEVIQATAVTRPMVPIQACPMVNLLVPTPILRLLQEQLLLVRQDQCLLPQILALLGLQTPRPLQVLQDPLLLALVAMAKHHPLIHQGLKPMLLTRMLILGTFLLLRSSSAICP